MNIRARNALLAAAIAAALPTASPALNVNPDGLGQVLLYPYYTVNAGQQTLVTVVNHTNRTKAVRVRFREGRNGRQVLDFNLYLSPFDVWVAGLVGGQYGPAELHTLDTSCTVPQFTGARQPFLNYAYSAVNQDHPNNRIQDLSSLERTREGMIEIIEMGVLQTGTGPTQLAEEATHTAAGVPLNCTALLNAWLPPGGAWSINPAANIGPPTGGLFGHAAIVDVEDGTLLAYDATALTRFYTNAAAPGALHASPGIDAPNLNSADNGNGQVLVDLPGDDGHAPVTEVFTRGPRPDAVSLALQRYGILNEYNTDPFLAGATEWVVTFPTKPYYTDVTRGEDVAAPFSDPFRDDGEACEEIKHAYYNREAREPGQLPGQVIICTPPPGPPPVPVQFCGTANVMAFNQSQVTNGTGLSVVLGSATATNLNTIQVSGPAFTSGFARFCFDDPTSTAAENVLTVPASGRAYQGLPVLGFSAIRGANGAARPGVMAVFGDAYRHQSFIRRGDDPQ